MGNHPNRLSPTSCLMQAASQVLIERVKFCGGSLIDHCLALLQLKTELGHIDHPTARADLDTNNMLVGETQTA